MNTPYDLASFQESSPAPQDPGTPSPAFTVLLRSSPDSPQSLKQALDFCIAAAAFGHPITLIATDEGLRFFLKNTLSMVDEAQPIRHLLTQLPLFDVDPIWICSKSLERHALSLSDFIEAHFQEATPQAFANALGSPNHTLVF